MPKKDSSYYGLRILAGILEVITFLTDAIFVLPDLILRQLLGSEGRRVKSRTIPPDYASGGPYRNSYNQGKLTTHLRGADDCSTVAALFRRAHQLWGTKRCLGSRELLSEEDEAQPNGKVFVKAIYGEYRWMSYDEVVGKMEWLGYGLLSRGLVSGKSKLGIFAETQASWMVVAQTAFRFNFPVVTLYATLGQEALVSGLQESEVDTLVTDSTCLKSLLNVLDKLPALKTVILIGKLSSAASSSFPPSIQLVSIEEIENDGKNVIAREDKEGLPPYVESKAEDLALVMYTSGSTGKAKGVMILHRNLVAGLSGQCRLVPDLCPDDTYIGYLPLAHVLELSAELGCLFNGCPIGYSSAQTITDTSSRIKKGSKGDMSVLRPTLFATVPVIMDRLKKAIEVQVARSSFLTQVLFRYAVKYKEHRGEQLQGFPLLDALVFKAARKTLGGRCRLLLCGGAPLSTSTQRFLRSCFSCPIQQGYGLTETCGAGSIGYQRDTRIGHVGPPLPCNEFGLLNWEEGGYRVTDKPNARGELVMSGGNITLGYFNRDKETAEAYVEIDGKKWFKTGDIAEVLSTGNFKIIDRKKDLVKLNHGEYISLGKIEMALKTHPVIDNACIYADSRASYSVCLALPNAAALEKFAKDHFGMVGLAFEELCRDAAIVRSITTEVATFLGKCGLNKVEIPAKIQLCPDTWLPGSDFLTDSMKLRRVNIYKMYRTTFNAMYNGM